MTLSKSYRYALLSNLNTATYQLARYLAKTLSPLSHLQYTIEGSDKFVNMIKQQVIPSSYKLVSFDIKYLFEKSGLVG